MDMQKRFRLECGPFIMEVIAVPGEWIARVDGCGEHYKASWPDATVAKQKCIEAAQQILISKRETIPPGMADPQWT